MDRLILRRPDDFHVHLRQGDACLNYARDAEKAGFARVLVMPNTLPAIVDAQGLKEYRNKIVSGANIEVLMTFKIQEKMDRFALSELKKAGAVAGKLYPEGVTTNSENGIRKIEDAFSTFELMEELDLVLCLHGEDPHAFSLDREKVFLTSLQKIRTRFPKLRIVLEHVSTKDGVEAVLSDGPLTAATLTIHHLLATLDDMLGGKLNPHLFCKPLLKRPEDRDALVEAALSGNPKFFYGSDSAPHTKENKEASLCSAGCYTMPVSLPLLAQLFVTRGKSSFLENFVSRFGAEFYRLPLNEGTITLAPHSWTVASEYHGVVPFKAGERLSWSLESVQV